jgi:hypothetical protein
MRLPYYGEIVVFAQKSVERRQRAGRDELGVRCRSRIEGHGGQPLGSPENVRRRVAAYEPINDRAAVSGNMCP